MKALKIFKRDAMAGSRDMLILYIIVIPILMAFLIQFLAPGMADNVIRIAMVENEKPDCIEYMQSMAKVELYKDRQALETRVLKRDDVPGLISNGSHFDLVTEGNEDSRTLEGAKKLIALYEMGSTPEKTTAEIYDFGKQVPQTRTMLTNMLLQLIIMLGGMIIALNVVEEKTDNTISAARVAPVSLLQFVMGKCMLGLITTLISIFLCLLILDYTWISFGKLLLVALCTMVLAVFTGLCQGVISSDIIEAAAGVKMLMLPMVAAILIYELCSERWQWTMWWNPFYWSYKGSYTVLSGVANWGEVVLWSALTLGLSLTACRIMWKTIDKGLRRP